jgi:hypothetical protein
MNKHRLRRIEAELAGRDVPARPPREIRTTQDVIDLLEEEITVLRGAPGLGAVERARAIGYLAGLAGKAIEASTVVARIEMLEAVLKQRHGDGKP